MNKTPIDDYVVTGLSAIVFLLLIAFVAWIAIILVKKFLG